MSIEHFENVAPPVANDPTSGYSDVQAKIRDATSNDPSDWGPSGTQMREIAKLTYDRQGFAEVVERMHKRLSAKGKKWKWRQIFKVRSACAIFHMSRIYLYSCRLLLCWSISYTRVPRTASFTSRNTFSS
ncbi:hypothetical protein BD410DRAFT_854627 [Rickenella mellea]|uniref:ENTH domain-containing protein n=1 Tax=Rickenella mellea TaxID=50990 RepID=A0A4Y7QAW5_9AGAM|nr:hypothetical protein BD410DRAFT_854627 [Rickenella mellea]